MYKPYPKLPPKEKTLFKKKTFKKREATGEREVFLRIWNSRPHRSQISGEPIYEPTATNFLHILAKGQSKFPKFKLYEKNIILGTEDEHYLLDNGSWEELKKLPEWNFVFTLMDELKEEYKKLP